MHIRRLTSRPALGIALLATVLVLVDLGRRILATNDEARFALLAQGMLDGGAWFFPQLNGVVYHSKPLLQAWLIALCSWPLGHVTQLTAVLPSALAGIGTALVVYAIGRDMFGSDAGRFAALVVLTTQGWFLHARLPMPDMLLTVFITASLAMFWRVVSGRSGPNRDPKIRGGAKATGAAPALLPLPQWGRGNWSGTLVAFLRSRANWLGFYGLVALAFWAKGVVGLVPLVVLGVYAIATRRLGRWRDLHLSAGVALVAVLIAPWWVRQWLSDTAALREVVVWDYAVWYVPRTLTVALVTGPLQHVVGVLFPWVLVVPAVIWQAARFLRGRGAERDAVHVLVLWSAVVLGCVAISEQQRLRYYVPLVPPVALLVGWWWAASAGERRATAQIPWRIYGIAAGGVALATVAAFTLRPTWTQATHVAWPGSAIEVGVMAGGLLLMVAALGYGMRRNALGLAFGVAWLGSALWVGGWYHWELERRNAAYDYPRVQAEAERLLPGVPVVAAWGVYDLPFSFYLDRSVVSVATDDELRRAMAQHPRASAVLTLAALAQVEDRARLRVLPLERLNFESIVLVTYASDAPPADARR